MAPDGGDTAYTGLEELTCLTWVGAHPGDELPVACWVAHPTHPQHADQAAVLAAVLRAPRGDHEALVRLDPTVVRVGIERTELAARLLLWERPVAEITCEDEWCTVAAARGWVLLVITERIPPSDGQPDAFGDFLADLVRVHMGVVEVVWETVAAD